MRGTFTFCQARYVTKAQAAVLRRVIMQITLLLKPNALTKPPQPFSTATWLAIHFVIGWAVAEGWVKGQWDSQTQKELRQVEMNSMCFI